MNSLIVMTKAFKETSIKTDLIQSSGIMERISREIRQAYGVNTISASDLKLNTKDENGNNKTVRFLLSGTNIEFFENDILTGNLNTPNIEVTAVSFTEITSAQSKAIKISFSVQSIKDSADRVVDFYDTIVLRGDYSN